jgi:KaiC/GvpD/RAD55 family RecA-like ATPase
MRTLKRVIGKRDIGGEPLPTVFRAFAENNITFRRGGLHMIAGTPGAGKSTVALAVALRAGVRTLYFSADTDQHTMAMRLYSMLTGEPQREAERIIAEEPDKAKEVLSRAQHIFWSFDSSPTVDDIIEEVLAFEEVWGSGPEMVVVDNLMDVNTGSQDFTAMKGVMNDLKYLARKWNTAVTVLHHTKESYTGNPCQPMSAVQGMVNQLPALILTVGQAGYGTMGIAAVKNRYGMPDPSGENPVWLQFNGEYMYIADLER